MKLSMMVQGSENSMDEICILQTEALTQKENAGSICLAWLQFAWKETFEPAANLNYIITARLLH